MSGQTKALNAGSDLWLFLYDYVYGGLGAGLHARSSVTLSEPYWTDEVASLITGSYSEAYPFAPPSKRDRTALWARFGYININF